ncbi:MAG TPA: uracil-DNA glycosylase [Candidatus Eisenbacteria bacterium]|nr:uracil-DNA glycosylase [Candidatus Eisenbacteria bacterium]
MELRGIAEEVIACERCPRLRAHCREVAATRRAAYRDEPYWGLPVPGFGDPEAWLLLVGLAPGAHGANRTGRMFTGDRSGEWLYQELHRQDLADRPRSERAGDGLRLRGVYITAAGRCAPPGNKPEPVELERCRPFLAREMRALSTVRVRMALGKIGHDAFLAARRALDLPDLKPKPVFHHGGFAALPEGGWLLDSYHPSQQNTSTGVLTLAMWGGVFETAKWLRDRVSSTA